MSSEHTVHVTEATFQRDVLDFSKTTPVLIDFWAEWCQPCKTIGPILEELVETYQGAFRLAKVDVDVNQQLATAAQVQSIPTLMMAFDGAIIDRVVGALSKSDFKEWIDRSLAQAGVEVKAVREVPSDPAGARVYWSAELEKDPKNSEASLALGRLLVDAGQIEEAKPILESIDATAKEYSDGQSILSLLKLLVEVADAGGEAAVRSALAQNPEDSKSRYLAACAKAGEGKFVAALGELVELVAGAKQPVRDHAKSAASIVLSAAGRGDDEIENLRRRLAGLLY